MLEVVERSGDVAGVGAHWREAPAEGRPPILYVHGVPTASWDWIPYLERIGGVAPDLPGFGSSAKPANFDYSIDGYTDWLESFTGAAGLDRFSLVVHDWGGLGSPSRSGFRSGSSGSSCIPALRFCPAIAGIGSRGSGARRSWASCSWPRRASGRSSKSRANRM